MPLPVLVFLVRTLVVLFFTLAEAHIKFRSAFVPMQVQWNKRKALALDGAGQAVEFVTIQEQFSCLLPAPRSYVDDSWDPDA